MKTDSEIMLDIEKGSRSQIINWSYKILLGVVMSFGAWFGSQVWSSQKEIADKMDRRLRVLEDCQIEVSASRFTSKDWTAAKAVSDAQAVTMDKRVYQLEIGQTAMQKSLDRIENKLGTIKAQ